MAYAEAVRHLREPRVQSIRWEALEHVAEDQGAFVVLSDCISPFRHFDDSIRHFTTGKLLLPSILVVKAGTRGSQILSCQSLNKLCTSGLAKHQLASVRRHQALRFFPVIKDMLPTRRRSMFNYDKFIGSVKVPLSRISSCSMCSSNGLEPREDAKNV